jgi:hypothetical protein
LVAAIVPAEMRDWSDAVTDMFAPLIMPDNDAPADARETTVATAPATDAVPLPCDAPAAASAV